MELIDHFKYMALLATLESVTNRKNAMTGFIKKIFIITDSLYAVRERAESLRYAFMLITKATHYNPSVNKCPAPIYKSIGNIAKFLIRQDIITVENVLETYEFWTEPLEFNPDGLSRLAKIDKLIAVIGTKHGINIQTYQIKEFYGTALNTKALVKLYLINTIGTDSALLKILGTGVNLDTNRIGTTLTEQIENLQIILKENNEQHSRGITTI